MADDHAVIPGGVEDAVGGVGDDDVVEDVPALEGEGGEDHRPGAGRDAETGVLHVVAAVIVRHGRRAQEVGSAFRRAREEVNHERARGHAIETR